MALTHYLLLECEAAPGPLSAVPSALAALCQSSPVPLALERLARQAQGPMVLAYLRLQQPEPLADQALLDLRARWVQAGGPPLAQLSRLELVYEAAGFSHAQTPVLHYVVETDPEDGWEAEIFRWYDEEHMPGLAAVPGCTLAQRLINHDAGPRSHACYGLLSEDTLGSPPWLAVRHTDWSSRCRPHFTNTRRTMLELVSP